MEFGIQNSLQALLKFFIIISELAPIIFFDFSLLIIFKSNNTVSVYFKISLNYLYSHIHVSIAVLISFLLIFSKILKQTYFEIKISPPDNVTPPPDVLKKTSSFKTSFTNSSTK